MVMMMMIIIINLLLNYRGKGCTRFKTDTVISQYFKENYLPVLF